jgi:hypothetical protein
MLPRRSDKLAYRYATRRTKTRFVGLLPHLFAKRHIRRWSALEKRCNCAPLSRKDCSAVREAPERISLIGARHTAQTPGPGKSGKGSASD